MASAAVINYNTDISPSFINGHFPLTDSSYPEDTAKSMTPAGMPPARLDSQLNINHLQQTRFGRFNPSVNSLSQPSAALPQQSARVNPLATVVTMAPLGPSDLYQDVNTYKRVNQAPRSMMEYAEPLYGNARGEQSAIPKASWQENKPQPLLIVNNNVEIRRQKLRERMCRF